MIPFALAAGQLHMESGENREVRITEPDVEGFCFRTAEKLSGIASIELSLYCGEQGFQHLLIEHPNIISVEEKEFCTICKVEAESPEYRAAVNAFYGEYQAYVESKLEDTDDVLALKMTGYPAGLDQQFADTFHRQRLQWGQEVCSGHTTTRADYEKFEMAVSIDNPRLYELYAQQGTEPLWRILLEENAICNHPLAGIVPKRIYAGNAFCHNLAPSEAQLYAILEKARSEGTEVTLVTTYLREEYIEKTKAALESLYEYCKTRDYRLELVVNDWGMLTMFSGKTDYLKPLLGTLINKRKKDPRAGYLSKNTQASQTASTVSETAFRKTLREKYGINRYEWEAGGGAFRIPEDGEVRHSLTFPYFRTNTSQYCPLYAKCTTGERGQQTFVRECPKYCEQYVFLYPEHLKMVGRYNSLFGFDDSVLTHAETVAEYAEQGIDRLVLQLPG